MDDSCFRLELAANQRSELRRHSILKSQFESELVQTGSVRVCYWQWKDVCVLSWCNSVWIRIWNDWDITPEDNSMFLELFKGEYYGIPLTILSVSTRSWEIKCIQTILSHGPYSMLQVWPSDIIYNLHVHVLQFSISGRWNLEDSISVPVTIFSQINRGFWWFPV